MGYITLTKGKHPAFLTFNRLNSLLADLRASGKCPDACSTDEFFGGKSVEEANKAICKYLKKFEKNDLARYLEQYYEFNCFGEEAKNNLYSLLDAAAIVHKFSGFKGKNVGFDVRFPYGKRYFYVFSTHRENRIELLIDTDELIEFYGNLHCFVVIFQSIGFMVDHGSVTIFCGSSLESKSVPYSKKILASEVDNSEHKDECDPLACLENDSDLQNILHIISEMFAYYQTAHDDNEISDMNAQTIHAVHSFAKGESFEYVSLSLELQNDDERRYLSFSISEEELLVVDGGYVYNPEIGGDSFTNWDYTLRCDGTRDGTLFLDENEIMEFIDCGAILKIDSSR